MSTGHSRTGDGVVSVPGRFTQPSHSKVSGAPRSPTVRTIVPDSACTREHRRRPLRLSGHLPKMDGARRGRVERDPVPAGLPEGELQIVCHELPVVASRQLELGDPTEVCIEP